MPFNLWAVKSVFEAMSPNLVEYFLNNYTAFFRDECKRGRIKERYSHADLWQVATSQKTLTTTKSVLTVVEIRSLKSRSKQPRCFWRPQGGSCPCSQQGSSSGLGFFASSQSSVHSHFCLHHCIVSSYDSSSSLSDWIWNHLGVSLIVSPREVWLMKEVCPPMVPPMGWGPGTNCRDFLLCFLGQMAWLDTSPSCCCAFPALMNCVFS